MNNWDVHLQLFFYFFAFSSSSAFPCVHPLPTFCSIPKHLASEPQNAAIQFKGTRFQLVSTLKWQHSLFEMKLLSKTEFQVNIYDYDKVQSMKWKETQGGMHTLCLHMSGRDCSAMTHAELQISRTHSVLCNDCFCSDDWGGIFRKRYLKKCR